MKRLALLLLLALPAILPAQIFTNATRLRGQNICAPLTHTDGYVLTWSDSSNCAGFAAGAGGTAVAPATYTFTTQTTVTISATGTSVNVTPTTAHGQGTTPVPVCWDASTPREEVACKVTKNTSGDLVFTFSPAQSGQIIVGSGGGSVSGSGNSAGATGTLQLSNGANGFTAFTGALVTGSNLALPGNLTITGTVLGSANGALSAPGVTWNGTWITGGTSTTTKPYMLVQPTGTVSSSWSTGGTGLGVNAASGFSGNLFDFEIAAVPKATLSSVGTLSVAGNFVGSVGAFTISANGLYLNTGASLDGVTIQKVSDGVASITDGHETGFGRLCIGPCSSSFPALKRSSTALQVRLADDSNYAPFAASAYSVGATAGVDATCTNPVATITVTKGIVTAITCP